MNYVSIGDILVWHGQPPSGNPYKPGSLLGKERSQALGAFLKGMTSEGFTFWFAPVGGGAYQLTTPPLVDPRVIDYYWPNLSVNKRLDSHR